MAQDLNLDLEGIHIVDPTTSPERKRYARRVFDLRHRKGVTMVEAEEMLSHRNYFAAMMVEQGDADGMISGMSLHYPDVLRPALQIIGTAAGNGTAAGVYMVTIKDRVLFFADCTVNIDLDAEKLAEIAILTARLAHQFDVEPRVAMLSFQQLRQHAPPALRDGAQGSGNRAAEGAVVAHRRRADGRHGAVG